jgi:hypothetical protein
MKKILNVWKQSGVKFSKQFSKFYREKSIENQSTGTGIKLFMNDKSGKFNKNMKNCSMENIERIWSSNEVFFVVDWQIFNSF